jgi:hypothetical protein
MEWEDLREEVCTLLEIGMSQGETELDTVTRLIWLERQKTLEVIENSVATAIKDGEAARKARVLQWKPPLCARNQLT